MASVRLAINVFDLSRMDPEAAKRLLPGAVSAAKEDLFRVGDKDEVAAPFVCDLVTAACIADVIRSHDRLAGDKPTRVYVRLTRGGKWKKVPADEALRSGNGLNPRVFPIEREDEVPYPREAI